MKFKALTLSIFAALLLTACGNKANEPEAKTTTSDQWQEIKPQDIDVNAVKMFADDWMLLSAGKDTSMNMMTIAWGALGELWGKPVVTVYVSTDRYTYKFLEDNEYFTVTAFPEQFQILVIILIILLRCIAASAHGQYHAHHDDYDQHIIKDISFHDAPPESRGQVH